MWKVAEEDAGLILDKFLAAEGRLGSRSKAAAARERGKVFVNGTEAGRDQIRSANAEASAAADLRPR